MRAGVIAAGAATVAYVLGSHWLMTSAPASPWNAVIVVGPMLVAAAVLAWQRGQRLLAALATLATAALVVQAWRGGLESNAIYVGQHVAIHLLLALVFGVTLQAGREPLVTALARRVHGGHLTPAMADYSRKVTIVWSGYFVAMAMLSLALFAWAPFDAWAAFANLATPLAMLLLFVGEYALRYRLHPEFERATLAQAMRAYAERRSHD